jgi:hypothetical protein
MMLIPREELRFDWQGARFDFGQAADRSLLGWVFNQFLYGEVTGIQCGHWLYRAPSLNAATFLAKQASEELSHVRKILRILTLLGEKPAPAHWAVRFMSTGMMGGSWGEHVTMEMALGEGLVLTVFYAMVDACADHPELHRILESAAIEEERHVEFGERETRAWLEAHPGDRSRLLGLAIVQALAMTALKGFVVRKVAKQVGADHPVMRKFGEFYEHTLRKFELRVERLGLTDGPLRQIGWVSRVGLLAGLPIRGLLSKLRHRKRLLTDHYLSDPSVIGELQRPAAP